MLNYLWGGMLLIGIIYAAITGNLSSVTDAALDSAKEAVTLCITMMGVMSFWIGLMRIAENAGIISGATRKLKPFLRFLFPNLPPEHKANEYIATNMIANIFGLGWAATPAGLKAMEALSELEEERRQQSDYSNMKPRQQSDYNSMKPRQQSDYNSMKSRQHTFSSRSYRQKKNQSKRPVPLGTANTEMCTFLIVNISSLQLIPVNIIAYRGQYGSVNPAAIVGPAIVATIISTVAGVIFAKIMEKTRTTL